MQRRLIKLIALMVLLCGGLLWSVLLRASAQPAAQLTIDHMQVDTSAYPNIQVAFDLKDAFGRPYTLAADSPVQLTEVSEASDSATAARTFTPMLSLTRTSEVSVVLVVDTVLPRAQRAAFTETLVAFARQFDPKRDRIFLVIVDSASSSTQNISGDASMAISQIGRLVFKKERGLSDVAGGLRKALSLAEEKGMVASSHSAVILASDFGGFDEPPPQAVVDGLLQRFKTTNIRFHSVLFSLDSAEGRKFQELRSSHLRIADAAYGTATVIDMVPSVGVQLTRILGDLRTQYAATYATEAMPGAKLIVTGRYGDAEKPAEARTPCRKVAVAVSAYGIKGLANIADDFLDLSVAPSTLCKIRTVHYEVAEPGGPYVLVETSPVTRTKRWLVKEQTQQDTSRRLRAIVTDEANVASISDDVNVTFLAPFSVTVSPQQDQLSQTVRFDVTSTRELSYVSASMTGPVILNPVIQESASRNPVILFGRPGGILGMFPLQGQATFAFEDEYGRRVDGVVRDFKFTELKSFFNSINAIGLTTLLLALTLLLLLLWHWQRGLVTTRSITLSNSGNAPARFALRVSSPDGYRVGLMGAGLGRRLGIGASWFQTSEVAPSADGAVTLSLRRFLWGLQSRKAEVQLQSAVLSVGAQPAIERGRDTRARLGSGDLDAWQVREPVTVDLPDRRWFWWWHLLLLVLLLAILGVAAYFALASEATLRTLLVLAR